MRSRSRRAFAALACFLLSACGYRFTAGGAPLPDGIRTVCVPLYENRTPEPGLEVLFTSAMRAWTTRSGVSANDVCDAAVEGEILSLSGGGGITAPGQTPGIASYRISAALQLRLVRSGRTVAQAQVSGFEDYLPARPAQPTAPAGDVSISEANRAAALHRLAQSLARDGYERLASGW